MRGVSNLDTLNILNYIIAGNVEISYRQKTRPLKCTITVGFTSYIVKYKSMLKGIGIALDNVAQETINRVLLTQLLNFKHDVVVQPLQDKTCQITRKATATQPSEIVLKKFNLQSKQK